MLTVTNVIVHSKRVEARRGGEGSGLRIFQIEMSMLSAKRFYNCEEINVFYKVIYIHEKQGG